MLHPDGISVVWQPRIVQARWAYKERVGAVQPLAEIVPPVAANISNTCWLGQAGHSVMPGPEIKA